MNININNGRNYFTINNLLVSYSTPIAQIINGEIYSLWRGHSMTSMRHIDYAFGIKMDKKRWLNTSYYWGYDLFEIVKVFSVEDYCTMFNTAKELYDSFQKQNHKYTKKEKESLDIITRFYEYCASEKPKEKTKTENLLKELATAYREEFGSVDIQASVKISDPSFETLKKFFGSFGKCV